MATRRLFGVRRVSSLFPIKNSLKEIGNSPV